MAIQEIEATRLCVRQVDDEDEEEEEKTGTLNCERRTANGEQ